MSIHEQRVQKSRRNQPNIARVLRGPVMSQGLRASGEGLVLISWDADHVPGHIEPVGPDTNAPPSGHDIPLPGMGWVRQREVLI